ncbi:MAG: mechanosensitive ion channel [Spirochaetales bacterium]|nr:mechanosensitive ion channel [Spirochaetales bacterium]
MKSLATFLINIPGSFIYAAVVILISIIALITILRTLRRATDLREKRIRRGNEQFPLSKPTRLMRKKAGNNKKGRIESVEKQFTITRKILVPSIIGLGIIISILPFINSVPAAFLSIFAAVFSLMIGIAAKPFLENLFAGLVISYSKSLNIGDTVLIDEKYGTVEDINLSYTTVKTWDWKRYVLPNIRMLQQDFLNFTLVEKYQWAYIEFWSAYENDLQEVEQVALDCAKQSEFALPDNVPYFWIMEMDKDGYKCWLASWAEDPAAAWALRNDLRTKLIMEFSKRDIKYHSLHHVVQNVEVKPRQTGKPGKP